MQTIVTVILPVFGLIGLGFVARRLGYLDASVSNGLSAFVFNVAVPVLIFRSLAEARAPEASPWPFWSAYFGGVAVAWAVAHLIVGRLLGGGWRKGVSAGITASFSNTVLLGVPLIYTAIGEEGAVPLFVLVSVHLPVMYLVATLLMEWTPGGGTRALPTIAKATALGLARNPIVIAILCGGLYRATGLPIPLLVRALIEPLSASAVPCALFAMGMELVRLGLLAETRATVAVMLIKLILHPMVVFVLGRFVFDLPPVWLAVAVTLASVPAGVNAYLFATRYSEGVGLASSVIALSTALAVGTVTLWLALLGL